MTGSSKLDCLQKTSIRNRLKSSVMGYFVRISCTWLLLAIQVQAETSGSLEITGSYFPKSLDASFDTNITAEAKVIGYEELDDFQLQYKLS